MGTIMLGSAKDLLRSAGIAVDEITIEQSPLETCDRVKIEGHFDYASLRNAATVKKPALMNALFNISDPHADKKNKPPFSVKKILKNGDYMTVLWDDGTKTIVKRASDEPESDYAAFTAAIGIRVFGSNSALKRIVESAEVQNKKKKKKRAEESEFDKSEFDKIGRAFIEASKELALELQRLREVDDAYDQQKTDEWLDGVERGQNK